MKRKGIMRRTWSLGGRGVWCGLEMVPWLTLCSAVPRFCVGGGHSVILPPGKGSPLSRGLSFPLASELVVGLLLQSAHTWQCFSVQPRLCQYGHQSLCVHPVNDVCQGELVAVFNLQSHLPPARHRERMAWCARYSQQPVEFAGAGRACLPMR